MLSFIFEASKNVDLEQNVLGVISGTTITANVPFGTDITSLIPTLEVSPKAQLTPGSDLVTDFSSPVNFTVTAEDGSSKVFTAEISVTPAPYIGKWESNAIDFGLGLMHVMLDINADGTLTLELKEMITGDLDSHSMKGYFDPLSKPKNEIMVTQTHQWIDKKWTETESQRTIMYHFDKAPMMHFFYCYCYPKSNWAFEVDLNKI